MAPIGTPKQALSLRVQGIVQGVGFRPFVQRLAHRHHLFGWVRNDTTGVQIHLEGARADLDSFLSSFPTEVPAAARIDRWEAVSDKVEPTDGFRILASATDQPPLVRVPPDLAVCTRCRQDVESPDNRRHGYALTTCIDCGPRFALLRELPFDRCRTAMAFFLPCQVCATEYDDPCDRRFHAQTIACTSCGPQVTLWNEHGESRATGTDAISVAVSLLNAGRILGVKGVGGFQLLVRADSSTAVARMRSCKGRPEKPFAVMVPDLAMAERLCHIRAAEAKTLCSPANPIVLLERRHDAFLAPEVAPHINTLGIFLPTTPLHHLLLKQVQMPIVATSGNVSVEPIVIDEQEVLQRLQGIADAFLIHNRPILHRVDDSVVRVMGGQPVLLRLARGYAPFPIAALERKGDVPPILAVGGQQKVALAAWTGHQAVLGPHIGDMDHPQSRAAFSDAVRRMKGLYQFQPAAVACDLHPDYFTSRWAAEQGIPVIAVQHHHAHAAAVMAEHDLWHQETLAFTWDGTGYGKDGTIWGGEALLATAHDIRRIASLRPFPLPGGEAAMRHPQRLSLSLLADTFGIDELLANDDFHKTLHLSAPEICTLHSLADKRSLSPLTSSIGRLFDAMAALILGIKEITYEGEAALRLEAIVEEDEQRGYALPLLKEQTCWQGDWRPLVRCVLRDLHKEELPGKIAARFHQTLANWSAEVADLYPGLTVTLGGGCFQNRVLRERIMALLQARGRTVFVATGIPPGDGGLAAGQLAVAMARMQQRG